MRSRYELNNLINNKSEPKQLEREVNLEPTNTAAMPRTPDELLANFTKAADAEFLAGLDKCYKYAARVLANESAILEKATDVFLIRKAEIEEAERS